MKSHDTIYCLILDKKDSVAVRRDHRLHRIDISTWSRFSLILQRKTTAQRQIKIDSNLQNDKWKWVARNGVNAKRYELEKWTEKMEMQWNLMSDADAQWRTSKKRSSTECIETGSGDNRHTPYQFKAHTSGHWLKWFTVRLDAVEWAAARKIPHSPMLGGNTRNSIKCCAN